MQSTDAIFSSRFLIASFWITAIGAEMNSLTCYKICSVESLLIPHGTRSRDDSLLTPVALQLANKFVMVPSAVRPVQLVSRATMHVQHSLSIVNLNSRTVPTKLCSSPLLPIALLMPMIRPLCRPTFMQRSSRPTISQRQSTCQACWHYTPAPPCSSKTSSVRNWALSADVRAAWCQSAATPVNRLPIQSSEYKQLRYVPQGLLLEVADATWIHSPELGPGRFFLPSVRRTWTFKHQLPAPHGRTQTIAYQVERLQLPVINSSALTAYALQGRTVPKILLDLQRPPNMSRVPWLHRSLRPCLVDYCYPTTILPPRTMPRMNSGSRCTCYCLALPLSMTLYVYDCLSAVPSTAGHRRTCSKNFIQRLRGAERATLQRLDSILFEWGLHEARAAVTTPLLQSP